MADNTIKNVLSVCATTADRVKDLVIKDGQLIFIQDEARIAFDFKGKRKFYNQIIELEAEVERENLSEPINGKYYFVIETAVFWRYYNGWQQLTSKPQEILFIGTELPELGVEKTLYVNKQEREISVWDDEQNEYIAVSNYAGSISADEVSALF